MIVALALCAVLLGAGSCRAEPAAPAMFKADPQLTAVYKAPPPRRLNDVRFSFQTGAPIRSTPALHDGAVYFGNADGVFFALDAVTGAERWRLRTDGGVTGSPAVEDGLAFFTTRGRKLYAVSTRNGRTAWDFAFGPDLGEGDFWDFYTSSPVLLDSSLYVGGGDGRVYAFDRKSGRKLWSTDLGARVRSTPAVTEALVVVGTMDGRVVALDRKSGLRRWSYTTQGASQKFADHQNDSTSISASPSIADGAVLVGSRDGFLYALDLASGAMRWRTTRDGDSWILSTAVDGGVVYSGAGSAIYLQASDVATGAERWRFRVANMVFAPLAIAGDAVLADDLDGWLHAVDRVTGAELWRFPMGGPSFSSPVVGDGVVYASSDEGVLYALNVGSEGAVQAPVRRLVYREGPRTPAASGWFYHDVDLAILSDFKGAGYTQVDAVELGQAMHDQIAGRSRSVVVFADNRVPANLLDRLTDQALIRRYLDAGGRVAFLGPDPLAFTYDQTGDVTGIDYHIVKKVLDVSYVASNLASGPHVSKVTREGAAWGLRGFITAYDAITPDDATTVLTRDEFGMATSWARRYGSNGGELVQLNASRTRVTDLTQFHAAIEHGLH